MIALLLPAISLRIVLADASFVATVRSLMHLDYT